MCIRDRLNAYALKTELAEAIPTIPDDLVNESALSTALTTALEPYAKTQDLPDMTKYALAEDIPEIPTVLKNNELQLNPNEEPTEEVQQKLMNDDTPLSAQASYILSAMSVTKALDLINLDEYVKTQDLPDMTKYALSTDIPEIPTDLVNESALTTALEPYVKTQDLPDMTKYALSTDIPKEYFTDSSGEVYIKDPNNILTLGGANQTCSDAPLMVMKPNHSRNTRILSIGNQLDSSKERWLDFDINVKSDEATIKYNEITALKITQSKVYIMNAYDMDGNAYAKINSNTTITHYCPIEESMNSINDFVIGAPVYMTGKVYKQVKNEWIPSTETDTTDCICSVKTNGRWNEYVGICVKIDEVNKCVTFATHGDYLVKVTDTSCYGVGDEVFIDEGELKTLTGQTAITSKIHRTTVGVITAKINDTMLAAVSYTHLTLPTN